MPRIEATGVGVLQPLHASREVRFRGLECHMVVVAHEHPCVDPPARHRACLAEGLEEEAPVIVISKNRFASIASRHDVVERSWKLYADAAGHESLMR